MEKLGPMGYFIGSTVIEAVLANVGEPSNSARILRYSNLI
jgi:hypothetical protein